MRFHSNSTFSDEEAQSGSATGFSDGEREEMLKAAHRMNVDPVTQILDKIDAELVSLTRSQGSSSTATTGTDNTVIRRPDSRQSLESSRQGNEESLSLSQLGPNFKPSVSLQSEHDTGIGTSSLPDSSLQYRSLEADIRPLDPGDSFREDPGGHHRRSATAPEMYLNGHHMSDDDKQKRENQTASPFESKHVDDKFKEILQKRKGGFLRNVDDDTQTIRTEDFVDKFQDTLVYSSADEAEKLRNIEDDLHSDGGSDTDTLQRKLAILTRTPIYHMNNTKDGGTRPLPRPKRKLTSSLEIRPRKAAGPGTPPVYPKPTPTTSLPRPSTRSSLRINHGHVSDADSVRTEDFEYQFKDMMVTPASKKEESDLESVSNDPIHTKVKQLLKATAKYKPKPDYKTKPHVRISPKPVQYENEDKGEDSDDTLCSDKHATVSSYRSWAHWHPVRADWNLSDSYSSQWVDDHHRRISKSPSIEESSSLSHSSVSSSDKEKKTQKSSKFNNDTSGFFNKDNNGFIPIFSRQVSQISNSTSLPSWSGSELPNSTSVSRCTSTGDSMFDDVPVSFLTQQDFGKNSFKDYQYSNIAGPNRRRSSLSESLLSGPYSSKKSGEDTMKTSREKRRNRDIIVQDEDEEDPYPFAKYTFNKKSENKTDDSMSTVSSMSARSTSQESIYSVGLMNQYSTLKNGKAPIATKRSSSSSMISSITSSFNEQSTGNLSVDDSNAGQDYEAFNQDTRVRDPKMQYRKSSPNLFLKIPPAQMQNPYNYQMYNFPQMPKPNPEQLLNSLGYPEAQSILPERFLKSWLEKALQTQKDEYTRYMMSVPQPPPPMMPYYDNPYYVDDSDLPPSISAQQSVATTPQYQSSLENIYGATKLFQQAAARIPQKRYLQRSHTFNSSSQIYDRSRANIFSNSGDEDGDPTSYEPEDDLESIGGLPLKKENSFDKLKRILTSSVPVHYKGKNFRRSAFASNHQKSLPIFLETLSEEDEEKRRSRTPSFDRNSTKSNSGSKMRSFLEEEEIRSIQADSSDTSSDFSRRSSLSGYNKTGYPISKDRCICSEYSDKCICLSPVESKKEVDTDRAMKNENFISNIPSIVVSEREVASEDQDEVQMHKLLQNLPAEMKTEPLLPRIVEETCSTTSSDKLSRPASPNPDNQDEQSINGHGHNFEIAEIMSSKNSHDKSNKKSEKRRGSNDFDPSSADMSAKKQGQFLSISTSEFDTSHKYLSPSSSIASPNIMSPVTVIEMHKLDNQNDYLELDEAKALERKDTRSNSTGTLDSKSQTRTKQQVKLNCTQDSVSHENCQKQKKSRKHQAPKCLKLKRHINDCDTISGKESTSDSENVFVDADVGKGRKDHKDDSVQADDGSLSSIIMISNVINLLQNLSESLPELIGKPLFVLAHDRSIQCNIQSGETHSEITNNRNTETKVIFEKVDGIKTVTRHRVLEPMNCTNLENEFVESDNISGEDLKDKYSQTNVDNLNIVGNSSVSYKTSVHTPKDEENSGFFERKFRSVKEFFVENFNDSLVGLEVPEVFKSEKTLLLKHRHVTSKIVTFVTDESVTLNTSCTKEPVGVTDETTDSMNAGFDDNTGEVTNCNNDFLGICILDGEKNEHLNSINLQQPEEEIKIQLDARYESENKQSCKNVNFIGKLDNINKGRKILESASDLFENYDNHKKADVQENMGYSDYVKGNEKNAAECNIMESSQENTKSNDLDNHVLNEISTNNLNGVETYLSDFDDNEIENENDIENSDVKNDVKHVNEKNDANDEIKLETRKKDIKESRVYHSECNIYPEVSFEGIKSQSENKLKSEPTDKYACSIFFKLETPNNKTPNISTCTGKDFFAQVNKSNVYMPSHDYLEDERHDAELENQNGNLGVRNESNERSSNIEQDFAMNEADVLQTNIDEGNMSSERIAEDNRESKDNEVNSSYLQKNASVTENKENTTTESCSKRRKTNLLTKFRDLIGNRIDVVENAGVNSKENLTNSETGDPRSQVISARSLDFETIGSRKNILHRCLKTGFAKSFDITGCDSKTEEEEEPNIVKNESTDITNSTHIVTSDGLTDSEVLKPEYKETEFEIRDYYHADECEKVMYQVGLNYNDDKKCYDVYGRVKIYIDDNSAAFDNDNNADLVDMAEEGRKHVLNDDFDFTEANIMKLISDEIQGIPVKTPIETLLTEMNRDINESQIVINSDEKQIGMNNVDETIGDHHDEEHETKSDIHPVPVKGLKRKQVFDMFQQVVEDEDDFLHNSVSCLADYPNDNGNSDNDNSYIDNETTRKTLEKIERLYSLSVYDDNLPEHFEMELSGNEGIYENGDYLDNEIKLLDLYDDEYGLTETHICKNCGHSVIIETTGRYAVGEVIEHDFCCNCSPLKFSVEMLERRRVQRLNSGEDPFYDNGSSF